MSFHSLKSSAIAINGLEDYFVDEEKTFASCAINKYNIEMILKHYFLHPNISGVVDYNTR